MKEHELADQIAELEANLAPQLPAEMLRGFQCHSDCCELRLDAPCLPAHFACDHRPRRVSDRHLTQTPDSTLTTVEKKELTFSVLSDVGNLVARKYGLVFVTPETARHPGICAANGDDSWELPMPATFIVAQDGSIRLAFVDADWTHRLEPAELLKALESVATNCFEE